MPASTYHREQLQKFVEERFDNPGDAWSYDTYVDFTHDNGYAPMTKNEYAYWVKFYAKILGAGEWCLMSTVYTRTSVPSWDRDRSVRLYNWYYCGPEV